MPPRRQSGPTLERIRAAEDVLPQEAKIEASVRLLAALRKARWQHEKGITPGTTSSMRAEARAFWPRRGKDK
jgi:hypothetical protein